jgi:L-2-hydroxyglutarate oxidase LhgO
MSFVWGDENVAFLRDRYQAMSAHHCYHGMEYSEDHGEIAQWVPLVMEGREAAQPIAATRMITGTDIDYGALTHLLVSQLQAQPGFSVQHHHELRHASTISRGVSATRPGVPGRLKGFLRPAGPEATLFNTCPIST